MKIKLFLLVLIISISFLTSCASISEKDAEQVAYQFIKSNVVFHTDNKTIANPYMQTVNKEIINDNFVFYVIATTTAEEKVKSAKFNIVVNKKGTVIRFNNKSTSATISPLPDK